MLGLRGVHRDLGVLEQRVDVGAGVRHRDEADARRHRQRQATYLDLGGDHVAQAPQRVLGVGDVTEDDPELVPAQSRDGVAGAHVGADTLGQPSEELVPALMPEGVVDVLEVIEVDDRHRHRRALRRGLGDRGARAAEEQRAVGQVGESVVVGQKGVDRQFAPQAPAHRDSDREQEQVEGGQAEAQIEVEAVQARADVVGDRRVGEVDLQTPTRRLGSPATKGR